MPAFPRIFVVSVTAAAATALTLGVAGVASASGGDEDAVRTCESFETQKDAQKAFELDLVGLANLDVELLGAKNGVACDKPKKEDQDDEDEDKDKKKKDDDDGDDDHHEDKKKDDKDDDSDSQVKVKPKGGVDTGGWDISA